VRRGGKEKQGELLRGVCRKGWWHACGVHVELANQLYRAAGGGDL
jgi:hypothetical protein